MIRYKEFLRHGAVLCFYVISAFLFFGRLFSPTPQVYLNPEYGASDISHFNIPVRLEYSRALKEGHMPLWSKNMGGGFPLYAESQIGAWYVPNLVIYRIFEFWTAISLSYVGAWVIGMFGMHCWLYIRTKNLGASVIGGWVFVFSGFFFGHLNHLNMLQTASLIPWICGVYEYARLKKSTWAWVLTIFLISQQILAGHLQTSFITGCLMLMFAILSSYERKSPVKGYIFGVLTICSLFVIGGLMSAVQILPSLELHGLSVRSDAFSLDITNHFSLHPKMFTTLLFPFAQGQLQDGSFTFLKKLSDTGAIFWESWMYMGWIVVLGLIGSIALVKSDLQRRIMGLWLFLGVCVGLMTARFSPLYFVFSIPPFNFFTTPARWMIGSSIILVLLGAEVLRRSPRFVQYVCVVALAVDVIVVWYPYGVRIPVKTISQPPATAQYIQDDPSRPDAQKRVVSLPHGEWSQEFIAHGWKHANRFPIFFNEISPNMNLIWNLNHEHEYVGRIWTQRKYIFNQYMSGLSVKDEKDPRRLVADRLMNLASIDYIISTRPLERATSPLVFSYTDPRLKSTTYRVYDNTSSKDRFWMTDTVATVATVEDVINELADEEYDFMRVFAEEELYEDIQKDIPVSSEIKILTDENNTTRLKVTTNKESVLISTDTYYPGWKVSIDGQPAQIYPVNIAQRAVVIPKGAHDVEFVYEAESYTRGAWISGMTVLIVLGGAVLLTWRNRSSASPTS